MLDHHHHHSTPKITLSIFASFVLAIFVHIEMVFGLDTQVTTITIDGLSLECEGCKEISPGVCKINTGKEKKVMPCKEGLIFLLQTSLKKNPPASQTTALQPTELIDYLLKKKGTEKTRQLIIQVLLQTAAGDALLANNIWDVFESDKGPLINALKIEIHPGPTLDTVFSSTQEKSLEIIVTLLPELVANLQDKFLPNLSTLLKNTTDSQTLQILSALNNEQVLTQLTMRKSDLKQVIDYLSLCSLKNELSLHSASEADELSQNCAPFSEGLRDAFLIPYAERLEAASTLKIAPFLPPQDSLRLVSRINYQGQHTPDLHQLLLNNLNKLLELAQLDLQSVDNTLTDKDSFALSENQQPDLEILNEDRVASMLSTLAKTDVEFAKKTAILFCYVAKESLKDEHYDEALTDLRHSATIFPHPLQERTTCLEDTLESTTNEHFAEEIQQMLHKKNKKPKQGLVFLPLAALALLIVFGLAQRRSSHHKRYNFFSHPSETLSSLQRKQLREHLRFFGLSPQSNEEALTAEFRFRAKHVHPDVNPGGTEEFRSLKDNYERALKLLKLRDGSLDY